MSILCGDLQPSKDTGVDGIFLHKVKFILLDNIVASVSASCVVWVELVKIMILNS